MLKRVSILDKASDHGNSIFIDDVLEDTYLDDEETRKQFFIYQDIISIWFKLRLERDTKNEFGVTEIGNYLLKHHQPLITEFAGSRITQSNRLQSKRTYLEKRIKDLTKLGILYLKEYTKAKKNNTETPIYEFTLEGKILSWLIVT